MWMRKDSFVMSDRGCIPSWYDGRLFFSNNVHSKFRSRYSPIIVWIATGGGKRIIDYEPDRC